MAVSGKKKLQGNKERDKRVARELRKLGWVVACVWEHQLKDPAQVIAKLLHHLQG
jgi:G:T-mismatch repair DNA endonuclease (very short patch repair protein)